MGIKSSRFLGAGHLVTLLTLWLSAPAPAAETAIEAWVQRSAGVPAALARVDGRNNIIVAGSGRNGSGGFVTIKYSGSGSPLWTNRYDVTTNSTTSPSGVAVDRDNNVIVTGRSRILGGGYEFDYATVKYSSAGVPLWTNRYSGNAGTTSEDGATGVAVDSSNNVIVTGYSQSAAFDYDFLTIKYSSDGLPLWTNRHDGPLHGDDEAFGLAVDGNDNIIVTGYTGTGSVGSEDFLTIAYSSSGVPLWTNTYNGPANSIDTAGFISVDSSNSVRIAGGSSASPGYPYDFDLLSINYSGTGTPLWTNRYAQPDTVMAMVVDSNNSVVVAGSDGSNYVIIKYSNVGAPLWTNRYNYSPSTNYGTGFQGIALDRSNNIVVAGFSRAGTAHFETIKYSSAGVPLWTNHYDTMGNYASQISAVACDKNDDVIVTGYWSYYTGQFPEQVMTYEIITIKYAVLGRPPVLRSSILANGVFQMWLEGYSLPGKLVIEVSSNLLQWLPVFTNSTTTNLTFYSDTNAFSHASRFYRAVQLP